MFESSDEGSAVDIVLSAEFSGVVDCVVVLLELIECAIESSRAGQATKGKAETRSKRDLLGEFLAMYRSMTH